MRIKPKWRFAPFGLGSHPKPPSHTSPSPFVSPRTTCLKLRVINMIDAAASCQQRRCDWFKSVDNNFSNPQTGNIWFDSFYVLVSTITAIYIYRRSVTYLSPYRRTEPGNSRSSLVVTHPNTTRDRRSLTFISCWTTCFNAQSDRAQWKHHFGAKKSKNVTTAVIVLFMLRRLQFSILQSLCELHCQPKAHWYDWLYCDIDNSPQCVVIRLVLPHLLLNIQFFIAILR